MSVSSGMTEHNRSRAGRKIWISSRIVTSGTSDEPEVTLPQSGNLDFFPGAWEVLICMVVPRWLEEALRDIEPAVLFDCWSRVSTIGVELGREGAAVFRVVYRGNGTVRGRRINCPAVQLNGKHIYRCHWPL